MTRAYVYLALFVLGIVIPNVAFVPWVMDHGFDISRLLEELFVNRVTAAFGLDLMVSALAVLVFVIWEGRRVGVKHLWLPILATFLVGLSCGLPLFLFMREMRIAPRTNLDS